TYQVQGQNYFSDQFRYLTTPQGTWADEIVAAHPVHSPVKVYYNPRDPADAILAPGVSGDDLHTALFFLPFNIAMVALWCMLVITVCGRRTRAGDPPAGIRVLRSEGMLRVPLPRVSPLLGTAGGTCLAAFLLGFMFPVD